MTIDVLRIAKLLHGMRQQIPGNTWNDMLYRFEGLITEHSMLSSTQEEGLLADFRKICLTGKD